MTPRRVDPLRCSLCGSDKVVKFGKGKWQFVACFECHKKVRSDGTMHDFLVDINRMSNRSVNPRKEMGDYVDDHREFDCRDESIA